VKEGRTEDGNIPAESQNMNSGNESSPEGTPKSRTMKHQDSGRSGRSGRSEKKSLREEEPSEEEEAEPSNASSERQAIMNELKNNILTHFQSIYQGNLFVSDS